MKQSIIQKSESLELEELKVISSQMGNNKALIQGSGGNTSLKEGNILFVKASGKKLSEAKKENIFVPIDLVDIRYKFKHHTSKDELKIIPIDNGNLKPSIETIFHAIMPHKIVFHSHSIEVIANTILPNIRERMIPLLKGYLWDYIPYARPGLPIAKLIQSSLNKKNSDVLILGNHGLIIGANSLKEAELLQKNIVNKLKLNRREFVFSKFNELYKLSKKINGAKLPSNNIINSLAIDPWSFELAQKNPPYPDHVVFCGKKPLIIDKEKVTSYKNFNEQPYIIIPNIGVLILTKNFFVIESMLEAQAEIFLRLNPSTKTKLLSNNQCEELISWEQEIYRKKLLEKK